MALLAVKLGLTLGIAYGLAYPWLHPGSGAGVFRELEMVGVAGAIAIVVVFLSLVFLYCRDLQRCLTLVKPEHRVAQPASVWWMFLLPYNFIEDFFIMSNIARSLQREAKANQNIQPLKGFGLFSGIGWCSAQVISLIPHNIGTYASVAALILWAIHWRFVRKVNLLLQRF